ncbi:MULTISPECIES: flagellar biosynthesis protein FlhB [Stutzerimonas stutzeri group]|jgi:flagellar biosynthetic protein FlhB|uniref:flagellar biosynthesis protein FlhB n=1 Tax=Stutzerimonas stutzeri group TaxID=136846 RepID=UPI0012688856|nr:MULTISPECIES: flagellar biosynthesis protein FlhB [Stutzerimonas stutzeri group]MBA4725670.1 flagellar type III secretion system protein FlhB [Pseudomonas sp.]MEC7472237.1 flagellar biosynthesis protein FlhB [Pseudomonadota bacterium]MBK3758448.1 flagellar type III secretion system protein FlhB [Stutzerimonas frequens]MBK3871141.1 flagellar type III secretion system protein FlhB [Stutzerimonas frequens]MBK3909478.1 flagellar type III secretion system protein FlhB [Stutzerimonas frequens]|tara:strand:+ start:2607 stop:3743 length:1137 start_codon:yes stop_codon:yes gene_type:complete
MAESESGADKSEEPTEKRLRESREKGQLARSRELSTVAVTLGGIGGLLASGGGLAQALMAMMQGTFELSRETLLDEGSMASLLMGSGLMALEAIMPLLIALLIASIVGPVALGGWLFSAKAMAPKVSRMNPAAGLKRMFSTQALVELLKALGKFLVVLSVALLVLSAYQDDLLSIAKQPLDLAIMHSVEIVGWCALWMACGLIIIAAVDVPFQLWDNKQKLMMTKQEVKDEYKDSEGKPEVKSRIRQLQREAAQRRMMQAVPEADVVITNPTHFAVALKYDGDKGGAPRLVAKGGDFVALKIREIAQEHKVTVLESPALARAVYYSTELDHEIPAGLYLAVAQVLAYVYQLRQYRAGKGRRPEPLNNLPIPPDLRRDE